MASATWSARRPLTRGRCQSLQMTPWRTGLGLPAPSPRAPTARWSPFIFSPHRTVTNAFCMAKISAPACLASCCSLSVSLLSDARQRLTWRQFYGREVLKERLLCGGTDINLLAMGYALRIHLSVWLLPLLFISFFFWVPTAYIFHFLPVYFSSTKAMLFFFFSGLPRKCSVTSLAQICWC